MMDPRLNVINKRFQNVKKIIAVSGGKGGIGKSQTAASLALCLAKHNYRTGLLDLDFCGPSTHVILGVEGIYPEEEKGIVPPKFNGISFMSITYYTGNNPSPLRGSEISNAIIEILAITRWEDLDFLIIDMPPGTGDPVLDVIRLIKRVEFLLVTTPSRVAQEVLKRELKVLNELGITVIGILENMKTKKGSQVASELLNLGVPFLGSIDFDYDLEDALGSPAKLLQTDFAAQLDQIISQKCL
ncbi:P-loop NTPase [Pelotomaculum propionicicum]|uniref:Iron-sulfur cluster carrier protein n=1 Tax=Pelotomaculum propionicicum TaxID=258475 RepID=A0A4Y7RTH2_9FIRM|nr:P-loop NTPase [Pelotomaculum propionicicum]TEB12046.1 Iron-sulfur cluster carrier protein [Pelotomaculum propionicicum]